MAESAEEPRRKRSGPTRREVPRGEKLLCVALLALIPAAVAGVWVKGQHYDAGLYALDASLVQATAHRGPAAADVIRAPAAGLATMPAAPAPGAPPAPGFTVPGVPPGTPPTLPGFPGDLPPAGLAPLAPPAPGVPAPAPAARPSLWAASFGDPAWALSGTVQRFGPENLYEKINGRAEAYLLYGMVGLETATYADRRDEDRFLDAFVYDMGKPSGAFGIYSAERPKEAKPLKLGDQGYRADASCFFIRGRYYVQVVASDRGAVLDAAALKLARQLEAGLAATGATSPAPPTATRPMKPAAPPTKSTAPAPADAPAKAPAAHPAPTGKPKAPDFSTPDALLALFPKESAVADSSQFLVKDALGLDFLTDVATQKHRAGGTEFTLFLTARASELEARGLVDRYVEFLGQIGKLHERRDEAGMTFLVGSVAGFYDTVFRAGPFLGGVNCAADRAAATDLAVKLLRSVASKAGKAVPDAARKLEHWPGSEGGNAPPKAPPPGSRHEDTKTRGHEEDGLTDE